VYVSLACPHQDNTARTDGDTRAVWIRWDAAPSILEKPQHWWIGGLIHATPNDIAFSVRCVPGHRITMSSHPATTTPSNQDTEPTQTGRAPHDETSRCLPLRHCLGLQQTRVACADQMTTPSSSPHERQIATQTQHLFKCSRCYGACHEATCRRLATYAQCLDQKTTQGGALRQS